MNKVKKELVIFLTESGLLVCNFMVKICYYGETLIIYNNVPRDRSGVRGGGGVGSL